MPLVKVPEAKFLQKLKRFFLVDMFKGMGLTLKFNVGALTDKDSVAGKGIYTEQYPKVRPDVAPRFHGAPTNRSHRVTMETDAPELLRRCREDGADAVVLVPS